MHIEQYFRVTEHDVTYTFWVTYAIDEALRIKHYRMGPRDPQWCTEGGWAFDVVYIHLFWLTRFGVDSAVGYCCMRAWCICIYTDMYMDIHVYIWLRYGGRELPCCAKHMPLRLTLFLYDVLLIKILLHHDICLCPYSKTYMLAKPISPQGVKCSVGCCVRKGDG